MTQGCSFFSFLQGRRGWGSSCACHAHLACGGDRSQGPGRHRLLPLIGTGTLCHEVPNSDGGSSLPVAHLMRFAVCRAEALSGRRRGGRGSGKCPATGPEPRAEGPHVASPQEGGLEPACPRREALGAQDPTATPPHTPTIIPWPPLLLPQGQAVTDPGLSFWPGHTGPLPSCLEEAHCSASRSSQASRASIEPGSVPEGLSDSDTPLS